MLKKLLPLLFSVLNLHAGWSFPPLPVSDRAEGDTAPLVCCNSSGQAFAVWREAVGGGLFNIQVSVHNEFGWSAEETISTFSSALVTFPVDICCNDSGRAYVIWSTDDLVGTTSTVFVSIYDQSWSAPRALYTELVGTNLFPQICCTNSNKAIAIWTNRPDSDPSSLYSSFFDGFNWILTPAITLASTNIIPALCCQEVDNNFSAFTLFVGPVNGIRAIRFNGSTWSTPPTLISTPLASSFPSVCCDGQGHALAVWRRDGVGQILGSYFDGSVWQNTLGNAFIITTGGINANSVPKVCCYNNTGNVIWLNTTTNNVQSAHFNGTSWSAPSILSTTATATLPEHSICCDGLGQAVATWTQTVNGVSTIYSSRFIGSTWNTAVPISDPAIPSSLSDVCCDNFGNAVAVWLAAGTDLRIESAFFTNLFSINDFRACSFFNRTVTQSANSIILSWSPTINPLIPFYRIYRNGVLIATLPSPVTSYKNCLVNPCETYIYSIVTVDSVGNESSPTTIEVGP